MSTNAGHLLWNRQRITVGIAATPIDTGLAQVLKGFDESSVNEPPLGIPGIVPPADGTLPASRVQVIPLVPTLAWAGVTHSEPYFNTTTNTVWVDFITTDEAPVDINVLFWDPSTLVGPGQADPYNPES